MNALSMESIFLILSGAVLAAGVLYWLWSHIQLMQKKVHLLENAVFELREIQGGGGQGLDHRHSQAQEQEHEQESDEREIPVYRDVDDNDDGGDWDQGAGSASTPLASLDATPVDLQPGGRIEVPEVQQEETKDKDTQFRELFIQHEVRVPTPQVQKKDETSSSSVSESLESMPVKELRRLAEQRGMTGVSELRKKELLAALRNQVSASVSAPTTLSAPSEPVKEVEVTVERTLDLTDDTIILE